MSIAHAGAEPPAEQPIATVVVARLDGRPILRAELDAAVRRLGGGATASSPQAQAQVLEQLIDERLVRAEIERAAVAASEKDINAAFEQARLQVIARGGTMEDFLAQTGRNEKGFRDRLALDLGINRLLAPKLTTAALEAEFAAHRRELDGSMVRASHIVLRPPSAVGEEAVASGLAQAEKIRRDVLRGSLSFADAAKKHSAGPSRHRGGDVGMFPRHGAMHELFAKQAFTLAKGEISKPFITPFGIHLLTVTAVEPGINDLAAVRPLVEQLLAQRLLREIVMAARRRATIEYEPGVPHLDPLTVSAEAAEQRVVVERGPPPPADTGGEAP